MVRVCVNVNGPPPPQSRWASFIFVTVMQTDKKCLLYKGNNNTRKDVESRPKFQHPDRSLFVHGAGGRGGGGLWKGGTQRQAETEETLKKQKLEDVSDTMCTTKAGSEPRAAAAAACQT